MGSHWIWNHHKFVGTRRLFPHALGSCSLESDIVEQKEKRAAGQSPDRAFGVVFDLQRCGHAFRDTNSRLPAAARHKVKATTSTGPGAWSLELWRLCLQICAPATLRPGRAPRPPYRRNAVAIPVFDPPLGARTDASRTGWVEALGDRFCISSYSNLNRYDGTSYAAVGTLRFVHLECQSVEHRNWPGWENIRQDAQSQPV